MGCNASHSVGGLYGCLKEGGGVIMFCLWSSYLLFMGRYEEVIKKMFDVVVS